MTRPFVSIVLALTFLVAVAALSCDKFSSSQPTDKPTPQAKAPSSPTAKPGEVPLKVACEQYAVSLCHKTKECLSQTQNVAEGIVQLVKDTDCADFGRGGCEHIKGNTRSLTQSYLERCLTAMETSTCSQVSDPKGIEACRLIEDPLDETMVAAEEARPKPIGDIGLGGANQGMLEPSLVCYSFQKGLCEKYQVCADKLADRYPPDAIQAMKTADCASFLEDCQGAQFKEAVGMEELVRCIDSLKRLPCEQLEGPSRFDRCKKIVDQLREHLDKTP